MHVGAKKIAVLGLLAAFSVLLIVLGAVIETSTLFLYAERVFVLGLPFVNGDCATDFLFLWRRHWWGF